jgi:O-acetyl-ADP-ribose deacetylase (regulator of RNase III)
MIELVQADITTLDVDAIVNAANSSLAGGGGVDGAIHRAAGPELARAAVPFAPCSPGHAVLTPGFRLRARFVVHTVGPIWAGGGEGEARVLRDAYESSFAVARREPTIRSIAFPAISTGAYGFPKEEAAEVALDVMQRHVGAFDRIVACLFSRDDVALYRRILSPWPCES